MKHVVAALLTLCPVVALAQESTSAVASVRLSTARVLAKGDPFSSDGFIDYIAVLGSRRGALLKLMQQYEEQRSDKQVGATASASGTTTLVSKGTVPKILGLAMENGAVSRDQSGTTVTFRSNLGGAVSALAGRGYLDLAPAGDPVIGLLNRLSISASFDTSRGSDAGTLAADSQQLAQLTARLALVNHRDIQNTRVARQLSTAAGPALRRHGANASRLLDVVPQDMALANWIRDTAAKIEAARGKKGGETDDQYAARLASVLEEAERSFPANGQLGPDVRQALGAYDASAVDFANLRDRLMARVNNGLLATLEYTNDRPLKAPRLSNVRFIAEAGGIVDLTGNLAVTFYDTIPVGATRRVRDYQGSVQLDVTMGSPEETGAFVLSFAGKFTRQLENTVGENGVVTPDTKGTTAIGQIKLTVPTKGVGVKIPISVTFANRTELIKEKNIVRANVGLTYDLDTIFARFKPGL